VSRIGALRKESDSIRHYSGIGLTSNDK
jgi:hypothetical protein